MLNALIEPIAKAIFPILPVIFILLVTHDINRWRPRV